MKKLTLFILFLTLGCENKIANVKKEVFESTLVRPIDNLAEEYRLTSFLWKEGVTSEDVATVSQILYKLQELSIQRLKAGQEISHSTTSEQPSEKDDGADTLEKLDKEIEELGALLRSKVDWIPADKVIFDLSETARAQDQAMGVMLVGFNPLQLTRIFTTEKRPDRAEEDITLYESVQEVSYDPQGGRIRFLVRLNENTYEFHLETVGVLGERPLFSGQLIVYQNEKPIRYGIVKLD